MGRRASRKYEAQDLLRVLEVTRRLAMPIELDELLEAIIEAGRGVLGADRGTVFLYEPARRELWARVATGERAIRFSIDEGLAGACARAGEVVNVPDCAADDRFNPEIDRRTGYRTRALIAVPLIGLEGDLVGVMQLLNPASGRFDAADEGLAEVLAAQAAAAIERTRLLETRFEKVRLEEDMDLARQVQQQVLPRRMPARAGYELAGASRPADETGGDLFDVVETAGGGGQDPVSFILADATGHGIGAALSVNAFRAMARLALRSGMDPEALGRHVNDQLVEDLGQGRFVTALIGRLDPCAHGFTFQAFGQGPILHVVAATGELRWSRASTVPLGIVAPLPAGKAETIEMAPGDLLLLLTDGFYERAGPGAERMDEAGVAALARRLTGCGAEKVLSELFAHSDTFAEGRPSEDDMTAIVIRRRPLSGGREA